MNGFINVREPPPNRRALCDGGQECHLTEAAVMIAFALHLLQNGASQVDLHPDGEHGKRHDIEATLEAHGFKQTTKSGTTRYGGTYSRGHQIAIVNPRSGLCD